MPSRGRNRAKPSGNQLNRCRLVRQRRSRVALRSSLRAALMKPHLKQWPEMFSSLPWVILVFVGNNFIFQETTLFFRKQLYFSSTTAGDWPDIWPDIWLDVITR